MDPCLYKAIMEDDINVLDQYNSKELEIQVTLMDDTVLHVAAQFGSEKFVKKILDICPFMARHRSNIRGDSAFHVAVREGYVQIAKAILECANRLGRELESGDGVTKELLRATNKVGDTALHLAVRCQWPSVEMVRLLLQEDSEFQPLPNNVEETPLYVAAERGHVEVMAEFLENCTSLAVCGPCGRTALHGAVIFLGNTAGCTKLLLDAGHKYGIDLTKVKDVYGWTPLHYAARNGDSLSAKLILERDKSTAYIGTENENNTPLHLAAASGRKYIMADLLSYSPDCWAIVNKKGYNVLHVAVDMEQEDILLYIERSPILRFLINQQDKDGNTPLHLLVEKQKTKCHRLLAHRLADLSIFNNKNLMPMNVIPGDVFPFYPGRRNIVEDDFNNIKNYSKMRHNIEEKRKARQQKWKEYKETMKKMGETHLIVATLVTTIAFTAAFTIPGGYDGNPGSNQGLAILAKTAAFKIFAIANSIALVSSLSSVIIYIVVSFCYYSSAEDVDRDHDRDPYVEKRIAIRYTLALLFIMIAIGSMMVAFVSGTYVILAHSPGLAIFVVTIGCLPFIAYVREVIKILHVIKSLQVFENLGYLLRG
ncbi:hypothetical protein NMG60_11025440 [Bertholletia excelsa]